MLIVFFFSFNSRKALISPTLKICPDLKYLNAGEHLQVKQEWNRLPKAAIFLTSFFAMKCIRGIIRSLTVIKKRYS